MQISLAVLASLLVLASTAPQGRPSLTRDRPQQGRSQNQNSPNTRFFTGNQAIDSAAWGAALGFKRGLDKVVITEVPLIKSISILLSHFNSFEKEFRK